MVKNPVLTLFLGFLPGIGHYRVGRSGRGTLYLLLCIMSLFFGIVAGAAEGEEAFFFIGLFFSAVFWLINFMDLIIYLVRQNGSRISGVHVPPVHPMYVSEQLDGVIYAPAANENVQGRSSERFYTILLSFIPGLGHLQLGLMQRGLNLMIGFFGLFAMIVFVAILADQPGFLTFLIVLPIIWIFGMFDAIRHVQLKQAGETLQDKSVLEDWEEHRQGGKRSKWLSTVLSIMPGAGHMYLGLQKRGLQLMAGFLLSIYLLDVLQLSLFLFLVPLFWCFSFFDALQMQSRLNSGEGELEDVPIVDWLINHQKWLGIGLMALGLYYIADRMLIEYIQRVWGDWQLTSDIRYYFKTGLTALLLIGAGVKLLSGKKEVKPE
ncbi:hypothetical protein A8990_1145 [Paenibacillus taihuensis]|uniref:Multi-TM2 domain-containing protein n=1 Tax=Paenibacillus taihuensis TaxID=1156355 RepID=A0A3D9S2S7_9BACL|nr:hypothetical protein [Paenibacillus taihuensis]REE84471.1 hypothetical protein A8990_1145 [Paenibacillus taihuensis]